MQGGTHLPRELMLSPDLHVVQNVELVHTEQEGSGQCRSHADKLALGRYPWMQVRQAETVRQTEQEEILQESLHLLLSSVYPMLHCRQLVKLEHVMQLDMLLLHDGRHIVLMNRE